MPNNELDFDAVCAIALKLEGIVEGTSFGYPSLKAHGKLLACPALHKSAEPGSLVVRIDPVERKKLISAKPDTYYLTEHYAGHPMVLVRVARLDKKSLRELLEKSLQFTGAKTSKSVRMPRPKSIARAKKAKRVTRISM